MVSFSTTLIHDTLCLKIPGASRTPLKEDDPLSEWTPDSYEVDMATNVTSAVMAAKSAIEGFKALPPSAHKTFIYTGNKLVSHPLPAVMQFGMGKTAAAHMVWHCSTVYGARKDRERYKFYVTDERAEDGDAVFRQVSGAHMARAVEKLVEDPEQGEWYHTFVLGDPTYRDFHDSDRKEIH